MAWGSFHGKEVPVVAEKHGIAFERVPGKILGLHNEDELFQFCVQPGLYPLEKGVLLLPTREVYLLWLEAYHQRKANAVIIQPLSCLSAILIWNPRRQTDGESFGATLQQDDEVYIEALGIMVKECLPRQHPVYLHCFVASWNVYMAWAHHYNNLLLVIQASTSTGFLECGALLTN